MDVSRPTKAQAARRRRLPISHPAAIAAVAVLLINDHVLKALAPGALTGKLSDVAGLIFFPVLVVSVVLLARRDEWTPRGRDRLISGAVGVTGIGFTACKTLPLANWAWNTIAGLLQWPFGATVALLTDARLPTLRPGGLVIDATDLLALPALGIALWIDRRVRIEPAKSGCARARRVLGAATLVVASLAVVGTSWDRDRSASLSAEDRLTVQLTPGASDVLLAMNVVVARGMPLEQATANIHAQVFASAIGNRPSHEPPISVQLTVVSLDDESDPPTETRRSGSGVSADAPSAPCARPEGCELRYLVAVSIPPDNIAADSVEIEIEAVGTIWFDFNAAPGDLEEKPPEGAGITIALTDDPATMAWRLGPTASAGGDVRLDRDSEQDIVGFAIGASADLVKGAADGPIVVARLSLDFEQARDYFLLVHLSGDAVGGDSERHATNLGALHIMPFEDCPGTSDCDRELLVTFALGGHDGPEAEELALEVEWWFDVLAFLPIGTESVGEVTVADLCPCSPQR
jgi:hypothetical protein